MSQVKLERASILSPHFEERESNLQGIRNALLAFGTRLNLFTPWVCPCGRPECNMGRPETFPIEQMMAAIITNWDPETHTAQEAADPSGHLAQALKGYLVDFGEAFDIFTCSCEDPDCPKLTAREQEPRRVLEIIWDEWSGRSGNFHHMPTLEEIEHVDRLKTRNLQILDLLIGRILHTRLDKWSDTIQRQRAVWTTSWYREAKHLVEHGRETWMSDVGDHKSMKRAIAIAITLPDRAGFAMDEARDLILAFGAAFNAILLCDIAHEQLSETLYEPLEAVIPFNQLRAVLLTGDLSMSA